jgi:hypothetical protein
MSYTFKTNMITSYTFNDYNGICPINLNMMHKPKFSDFKKWILISWWVKIWRLKCNEVISSEKTSTSYWNCCSLGNETINVLVPKTDI